MTLQREIMVGSERLDGRTDVASWVASVAIRYLRRVPDADECVASDVESVLSRGDWVRRDADLPADEGYGVLVLKPGIRATAAFVRELEERAGECGYGVVEARIV